jgi:hypothetical protein
VLPISALFGKSRKTETDKLEPNFSIIVQLKVLFFEVGQLQEILLVQYIALLPQERKLRSRLSLCVLASGREWCS